MSDAKCFANGAYLLMSIMNACCLSLVGSIPILKVDQVH